MKLNKMQYYLLSPHFCLINFDFSFIVIIPFDLSTKRNMKTFSIQTNNKHSHIH